MDCVFWSGFNRIIFYAKKIRGNGIMKKIKIKNKTGELTTQQLVTIIILIVSFGVILILLFRLDLGEITNREICHNSVVLKSKGENLVGKLDCKTDYLCISGGGECKDFNPTTTTEVDSNNKEEILKAIADERDNCWWMFGEGKLDYVGYSWKLDIIVGTHCAICSVVKFDEKIQEQYLELSIDNKTILTNEKYLIITGMKGEKDYISTSFIKSDQTSELECDEFITKA